jgi:hypothetical protein
MRSLAPVLGLGQIGNGNGNGNHFGGGFHHGHGFGQTRGWSPAVSTIGAGSGGVYVPQGHGLNFYGFPGVNWSPTLGYTNVNNNMPVIFGPLGQSNTPGGVVPGVAIPGSSVSIGHHH